MTYEYYSPPMHYDQIVATQGEVLGQWVMGTWQGDYIYLLKNDDKYSFYVIGYGSCSGCDALEACENDEEKIEFRVVKRLLIEFANKLNQYNKRVEEIKKVGKV